MKDSLQRRIYALLIMKKYPQVKLTKFAFNFIRYGYQSDYFDIHRDELETLEPLIKAEVEALMELLSEETAPEPSAGDHCVLCESRANCPAYKNAFEEIEQIHSKEDAINLYGHYKLAVMRVKHMEKILKFWIDNNENIVEGPGFNVFYIKDDEVYTPAYNCLGGITIQCLEDICIEQNIKFSRKNVTVKDLIDAVVLRFEENELEIKKLKFRVAQLEGREDGSKRSE